MPRKTIAQLEEELSQVRGSLFSSEKRANELDKEAMVYEKCVQAMKALKSTTGGYSSSRNDTEAVRRVLDSLAQRFSIEVTYPEPETKEPYYAPDPRDELIEMLKEMIRND